MASFKRYALAATLLLLGSGTPASGEPHRFLRKTKEMIDAPKRPVTRSLLHTITLDNGARLAAAFTEPEGGSSYDLDALTCTYQLPLSMEGSVGLGQSDISYIFVIDESGSTSSIIGDIKAFFVDLVDVLFNELSTLNIGVVRFDDENVSLPGGLLEEGDADAIKAFINESPFYGGTRCDLALDAANDMINDSSPGTKTIVIFAGDGECWLDDEITEDARDNLLANANTDVKIEVAAIGGVTCAALSVVAPEDDCQEITVVEDYSIEQVIGTTLKNIEFSADCEDGDCTLYENTVSTSSPQCVFPEVGPIFCLAGTVSSVEIGLGANEMCVRATGVAATDPLADVYDVDCMFLHGLDVTDPTFTCPDDVTQDTDPGECYADVTLPSHVSPEDNCYVKEDLTYTKEPSGPYFVLGAKTVIYGLADPDGNAATPCNIDVTIEDKEDPVVACPVDYTIETDPGECTATTPCIPAATATDNCEVASLTNNATAIFDLGETIVEWTAVDTAGNDDDCTFAVTLVDNEKPSVSCTQSTNPGGKNKPNGVNSNGFYLINAADNCVGVTLQLKDSIDDHEFTIPGGWLDGVKVKYTSSSSEQSVDPGPGDVDWKIKGHGDLVVTATDNSLNTKTVICVVPPRK